MYIGRRGMDSDKKFTPGFEQSFTGERGMKKTFQILESF
jgi:hypothetical protein